MSNKKYGLILPDKGKQELKFQASRNVFGDDSDSEDSSKSKLQLLHPSHNLNRQAKITQEKAVTEDPTVYQYDEIYDDMVNSKQKHLKKNKEEKKPRYIENLMKSANKRKIENERRIERQIQKEREKEGDEFKDKEVFVTTAYKKKLEEMKEEEEKEKREEYLESIGDVTKQRDLGGFYRHLYEQKLGSDKPTDPSKNISTTTTVSKDKDTSPKKLDTPVQKAEPIKKRNYRKRKSTEDKGMSDGEIEDSDDEINRLNLDNIKLAKKSKNSDENIDADSDFSIDESSDEESKDKKVKDQKVKEKISEQIRSHTPEPIVSKPDIDSKKTQPKPVVPELVVEVKPKIDIWKKRTVGEVFDQALKRYYERKAARGSK